MDNRLMIGSTDPENIRIGNRMVDSICIKTPVNAFDPILNISAKGLTTAGIAQANGVIDLSGNGNHGTAHNGVTVVEDNEMGDCFSFDGVDDYIILPTNVYSSSLSQLTVSLYVKIGSNNNASSFIINKRSQMSNYQWQLTLPDANQANLQWTLWQDSGSSSRVRKDLKLSNLELNKWYHAVITFDNTSLTYCFYLDGILADSGYLSNPINMSNDIMTIGCLSGGNYYFFKGKVNDVRIYPYALTPEQVKILSDGYERIWGYLPDNPVLQITARGLTTAGIAQSGGVVDLSGNGNNGTALGGVEVVNDSEIGECFQNFNSSGKYILIYLSDLIRGKSEFSCSIKIKSYDITDQGSKTIFAIYTGSSANRIDFQVNWGKFGVRLQDGSYVYTTITPKNNEIFHLVLTLKPDSQDNTLQNLNIYINGVNDSSQQISTYTIPSSATKLSLGSLNGQYNFSEFKISDFQIYPYALTANQIKRMYYFMMYPKNPILDISAKGLTTAGIAQTNGVTDLSGNNNHGTAYGGVQVVNDSELGDCFYFDGSNDYIRTKSNFDIPSDVTFVVTVKLDAITSSAIFSNIKSVNGSWTGTDLFAYTSKFNFEDRPYRYNIPSDTIQTGRKYQIVITSSSAENKSKMFLNGELIKTVDKTFTGYNNFNKLTIGADANGINRVKGLISDFKIYPRALTADEVKSLYLHSSQYMLDHHGI